MKYLVVILIVIALIVFLPIALIWALEALFSLQIALTLKTWLGALVLLILIGGTSSSK